MPGQQGHRGQGPTLILRWNTLGVTETVDVVLHFHGFSGRGAAMNLVSDKEAASRLDWSDPAGWTRRRGRPGPRWPCCPAATSTVGARGPGMISRPWCGPAGRKR